MYLPLIILFLYFSIFHIKSEYLFHKNDILFTFIVDTEHSIKLRVFVPFFYSENAFSDKLRSQEGKTADFIVQFPPLTIRYFTFYKYLMVPVTFYFGLSHQMGGYLSSNAGMTDHPAPDQSNSSTVILFCKNLFFLPYGISFCLPLYSCSSNGSPSGSWKKVIFFPV